MAILSGFAVDLIGFSEESELFWYVSNDVVGRLGFVDCVIYTVDREQGVLRQVAAAGLKACQERGIINQMEIPIGAGITGSVVKTGLPELINDLASESRYIPDFTAAQSEVCVPILVDGVVVGAIDCEDVRPGRFTQGDLTLLTTVAAMTGAKLAILHQSQKMQESEKTHRAIFANLNDAFCRTDINGRIVMVSPSTEKLFGYAVGEMIGQTFSDLYYSREDRANFLIALENSGGSVDDYEILFRHRDGSKIWGSNSSRYYYGEHGEVLGIEGLTRNITQKKNAEQALAQTQNQLLKAQKIALLGSWEYDFTTRRISWSQETFRVLGIDPAQGRVSSKEFLNAVHPDDRDKVEETQQGAQQPGKGFSLTFRYIMPDGTLKWIYAEGEPGFDTDGNQIALYGIMQDITQRMELEQKLQNSLDAAEAANRVKSDFLATMSHELRTPLNAILGFAEIISGEFFGPIGESRYRVYAKDILNSGQYLLDLINDLLDLSKVEAGAYHLQIKTFDLSEVTESCLPVVMQKALDTDIEIKVNISAALPQIMADQRAVKQVLLNLLSNALKFTSSHGTITISASEREGSYLIEVRDTGRGIHPDLLPLLGEPFRTSSDAPYQSSEGTGLGLTISKALVELHGGELTLESELGVGTCVGFTLPISLPQCNPDA